MVRNVFGNGAFVQFRQSHNHAEDAAFFENHDRRSGMMDIKNSPLKGRDFLKLLDYTPEEIRYLLDLSAELKQMKKRGELHEYFKGRNVALIFEKTSTRTRCSFEVAAHDLGMGTTYLDPTGSQIGKKESIADTARVLAGMYDGIEYRGFGQNIVEELAKYSKVPVWNGLTNEFHPTQMLADVLTIREHFGTEKGIHVSFYGDCRYNMANSWMVCASKLGMHLVLCSNEGYFPDEELTAQCRAIAAENGGSIRFETDPLKGAEGADVIYTDVWVSMGEPDEVWKKRLEDLSPYRVTREVMAVADETAANGRITSSTLQDLDCHKIAPHGAVFMHCLPSFHDLGTEIGRKIHEQYGIDEMEVTDEVFESHDSVVFDEAENRMHTIKAVMAATLE